MQKPDVNGTRTPFTDAAGRVICVGDHLTDGAGHHYRIDRFGRLVDVVGKKVEGIALDTLSITHIERAGIQRRLIPVPSPPPKK